MARQRIVRIKAGKRTVYYRDTVSGEISDSPLIAPPKKIISTSNENLPEFWKGLVGSCACRQELTRFRAHCSCSRKDITIKECSRCPQHSNLLSVKDGESKEIVPMKAPNLLTRVNNYQMAVRKWIAAGRPSRTQEAIDNIRTTFCAKCDWRDPMKDICKGCGCPVTTSGYPLLNKIAMATENCPKKLW